MYNFQAPLEVKDFSGGMSDNYIDAPINVAQIVDNFLIQKNKKLISRDGTLIYDSTAYQIPAGAQRISNLIAHPQGQLFVQSARVLNYLDTTYQTLVGPVDSNSAFSAGTTSNFVSWDVWKNHVYLSNDIPADIIKVYKNSSSAWKVNTAGLPGLDLEGAIDLANALKTAYNLHIADAAQHTTGVDTTNSVSSATATTYDTLITLVTELLTDYAAHRADAALSSGRAYHPNQEVTSDALTSTAAPTNLAECLTVLDDLRTKYNGHDNDGAHAVTGSHQVSSQRLPQITGSGSTNTYLYKFHYYYTYTVGDVSFAVRGPTLSRTVTCDAPGTISIANIPAISNGTTRCYDTSNITVRIYRTAANGSTFFYVGQVTNGTTTYSDTTADAALVLNETVYTEGGVLDNDSPPPAKYMTVVNGRAWYCHIKEGSTVYPSKFRPSKQDEIDAAPSDFSEDVEAAITGVNQVGIYPIIFCREKFYRIEGGFDDFGRGNIEKRKVSNTKGCISNNSIVQVPGGLVFAGVDNFYFTDGYSVRPLANHLLTTYKTFVFNSTVEKKIFGKYDSKENRVYWGVQSSSASSDNDKIFVLDLNFPLTDESVFVTHTNQGSWSPCCFEFYNGTLVIGDSRGYLFKFDTSTFTDPDIDTSSAPSTWATQAILWTYRGFATSFGTTSLFKFIPSFTLQAKNYSNVTIQVKRNNDDSGDFRETKEIRFRDGIVWGDPDILWGASDPAYPWNIAKLVKALRWFPQGRRCVYTQLLITNAYTNIYNSDSYGLGSLNSTTKQVTLLGGLSFPSDIVNYYISFEDDSYDTQFLITARNSDTVLTYQDVSNLSATDSSIKWLIKGYVKGEVLNLLSWSLNWAPLGEHQSVYRSADTGANA